MTSCADHEEEGTGVPSRGTLIFSNIRRLGSFFGGLKILKLNIFWGFQKK